LLFPTMSLHIPESVSIRPQIARVMNCLSVPKIAAEPMDTAKILKHFFNPSTCTLFGHLPTEPGYQQGVVVELPLAIVYLSGLHCLKNY
jgi:hypothetical protein